MSETVLTKGWKPPTGKCDFCQSRPATHWFGDTSVALCNRPECAEENQRAWDQMIEEEERNRD
jgi:hypothetical protein